VVSKYTVFRYTARATLTDRRPEVLPERTSRNTIHASRKNIRLLDGAVATIIVARNMSYGLLLLDHYRDRLKLAGLAGVLLAFLISQLLVRESLKPLRDIASGAGNVTVDRLDTRH